MKTLGYLLLSLGFLSAALVAVQNDQNQIAWGFYLPAWVCGLVGLALLRLLRRSQTQETKTLQATAQQLAKQLDRILRNLGQLQAERPHPRAVHRRVDELFREDLEAFVQARQSMIPLYGLTGYARTMNEFAAGERYLNRVWSASVDGYADEVDHYLDQARRQFERTQQVLQQLHPAKPH